MKNKLKIGGHFTLDGERWQVLGHSPNFVAAINSGGKRRRFDRGDLDERLRLKLTQQIRPDLESKPAWEENLEHLVNRCIAKCGVSREQIERLAVGNALSVRVVARELLSQARGG